VRRVGCAVNGQKLAALSYEIERGNPKNAICTYMTSESRDEFWKVRHLGCVTRFSTQFLGCFYSRLLAKLERIGESYEGNSEIVRPFIREEGGTSHAPRNEGLLRRP
jgi:hypothetical protein